MRKAKFNQTQIVAILKDAESGVPAADLLTSTGSARRLPGVREPIDHD